MEAARAERRAAHKAAIEQEKAAREEARAKAKAEAEAAAEAAAAAARSPVVPTAAELKAARDARYAARKARQGNDPRASCSALPKCRAASPCGCSAGQGLHDRARSQRADEHADERLRRWRWAR
jgi:hypothetical protein